VTGRAARATNTVYVANAISNSVSVISGKTHTVTATITVGSTPAAVAVNPATGTVYVTNAVSNTVSVISGT
jgi:YVTN family beta-propeller protein